MIHRPRFRARPFFHPMILIPVRVGPSRIHGQGLFCVEPVAAGTPVWKFQAGFDRAFPPAAFEALPPEARTHVRWFAYFDGEADAWILSGDHACFMNHDPRPNTGTAEGATGAVVTVALRDLAAGE